jgi:tRNA modification GTPase
MLDLDDTIAALASARVPALRGILRLSGPKAWAIVGETFSPELPSCATGSRPRTIAGCLSLPTLNSTLPATLFLSRAPRSYTGEDLVEVHTIGSPPILQLLLSTYSAIGARQAIPGEFTLRAFLNRRLDLTAAEAILGLIDATNNRQAEIALRQLAGGIARPIRTLRDQLLDLLADLEAGLDFAEEDLEFIDRDRLRATLEQASEQLAQLGCQMKARTLYTDRTRVILTGPPNAGKSSLFNALLGRQAALVGPDPGVTRDYLVAPLILSDFTIDLVDTAGIQQARDAISQLSQAAREQAAAAADLVLWCDDSPAEEAIELRRRQNLAHVALTIVRTKSDLGVRSSLFCFGTDRSVESELDGLPKQKREELTPGPIAVSALTGAGLDLLRKSIEQWVRGHGREEAGSVASTASRCRHSVESAAHALKSALTQLDDAASDELTAVEIRLALDELGHIVGAVYTDDILDRVFSRFCIGK